MIADLVPLEAPATETVHVELVLRDPWLRSDVIEAAWARARRFGVEATLVASDFASVRVALRGPPADVDLVAMALMDWWTRVARR